MLIPCSMILSDGAPAANSSGPNLMIPIFAGLAIFMVFSAMSKKKQDKARQSLLDAMKKGDRVRTIGGILGTIVEVREQEVVVKVDESNNTKIKFTRSAIAAVLGDDEKVEAKS